MWAKLLAWRGVYNSWMDRNELANQLLQQSLSLLERLETAAWDTRQERAFVLRELGGHTWWKLHDPEAGKRLLEQSLVVYKALGDRWGTGYVLGGLGRLAQHLSAYSKARELCEQSLALLKTTGDYVQIVWTLAMLSLLAVQLGEMEEAGRRAREGYILLDQVGGRDQFMQELWYLGWASLRLGRFGEACSVGQEELAFDEEYGLRGHSISSLALLSLAQVGLGQYGQARDQLEAGLSLAREVGFLLGEALGRVALAEGAHPEAQRLLQEGIAALEAGGSAGDMGVTLGALGLAARALGRPVQARQHLGRALRLATDIGSCLPLMHGLPGIALLLADGEQYERAVEVYALASRYPGVANSRWYEDVVGRHIASASAALSPQAVDAAVERGRARDLWATVEELLAELGG